MTQIRTGHFEADGAEVDLPLGFVPSHIKLVNANAADGEPIVIEWWSEAGDGVELWYLRHDNDGDGDNDTPIWKSTGGYVSEYDEKSVLETDPASVEDDYVKVIGGKGVTIAAAFMDNGDEIYFEAILADRDVDHGDINA